MEHHVLAVFLSRWFRREIDSAGVEPSGCGVVSVEIRTLSDLTEPDDRSLRFGGMGFSTGGHLSGEDAVSHQQRVIASADLDSAVPEQTRRSFERLRSLHAYGVLFYEVQAEARIPQRGPRAQRRPSGPGFP